MFWFYVSLLYRWLLPVKLWRTKNKANLIFEMFCWLLVIQLQSNIYFPHASVWHTFNIKEWRISLGGLYLTWQFSPWLFDGVVQWNLRMSPNVPSTNEGILSWSEFSKTVDKFFVFRYLKSVYWLSSVNCTQRVLTDFLVCVVPEECSVIMWWCCAIKLKNVNIFLLFWFLKSAYWLSSVSCTQRVLNVCLICVVREGVYWFIDGIV